MQIDIIAKNRMARGAKSSAGFVVSIA